MQVNIYMRRESGFTFIYCSSLARSSSCPLTFNISLNPYQKKAPPSSVCTVRVAPARPHLYAAGQCSSWEAKIWKMDVLEYLLRCTFHKRALQLISIEPNYFLFHLWSVTLWNKRPMLFPVAGMCDKRHQSALMWYQQHFLCLAPVSGLSNRCRLIWGIIVGAILLSSGSSQVLL